MYGVSGRKLSCISYNEQRFNVKFLVNCFTDSPLNCFLLIIANLKSVRQILILVSERRACRANQGFESEATTNRLLQRK